MSFVKTGDGTITQIIKSDSDLVDDAVTRRALAKAKAEQKIATEAVVDESDKNKTEQQ